jgi:hypothetical protein
VPEKKRSKCDPVHNGETSFLVTYDCRTPDNRLVCGVRKPNIGVLGCAETERGSIMTMTEDRGAPYNDLVEVPIGTFRHYMNFIVKHDLWDEATNRLQAAGLRGVVLGGSHVNVIREFVAGKGADLNREPQHAGALVLPECALVCRPPKSPADVPKNPPK